METRIERIAGTDRKITHADIMRLWENEDYQALKAVMPKIFFDQLSQGKWFWIGNRSFLAVNGYIEKINSLEWNYRSWKEEIRTQTRRSLQEQQDPQRESSTSHESLESQKTGFYRTLQFQKPYLRGEDVVLLQKRLQIHGCLPGKIDGVFWKNTLNAFLKFQKVLWKPQDGIFQVNSEEMRILLSNKPVVSTKNQWETQEPLTVPSISPQLTEAWITDPELQRKIWGSIVTLNIGLFGGATGTFIAPNKILTARHVVLDPKTWKPNAFSEIQAGWRTYTVKSISYDKRNDVATIETVEPSPYWLPFAKDSSWIQEAVVVSSFRGNQKVHIPKKTEKSVSTETEIFWEDSRYKFLHIPSRHGDSGSPVIDEKGRIVWIVRGSFDEVDSRKYSGTTAEPVGDILNSIQWA